jgi:hypothetical protein
MITGLGTKDNDERGHTVIAPEDKPIQSIEAEEVEEVPRE